MLLGHHHKLDALASLIVRQITGFDTYVHGRSRTPVRSQLRPHCIRIGIVRNDHHIVSVDIAILFDAKFRHGVVDREPAYDQRRASGNASDRHDQARLETEDIARSNLA